MTADDEIRRLALDGHTVKEIMAATGLTRRSVQRRISESDLPPAAERKLTARIAKRGAAVIRTYVAERCGFKLGSMGGVLQGLTVEQIDWLGKTVPEGATLAEFCAAVLRDLHADEVKAA